MIATLLLTMTLQTVEVVCPMTREVVVRDTVRGASSWYYSKHYLAVRYEVKGKNQMKQYPTTCVVREV